MSGRRPQTNGANDTSANPTSLIFNLDRLQPAGYCYQEFMRRSIEKRRTVFRYCGARSETEAGEFVAALSPVERIFAASGRTASEKLDPSSVTGTRLNMD